MAPRFASGGRRRCLLAARLRVGGIISFTGSFNYQFVQYASNCLSDTLVGIKRFEVVEREHIERILSEQRFQVSGAVNPDTAVRLGELLGIDCAFVGSLDRCECKSEFGRIRTARGITITLDLQRLPSGSSTCLQGPFFRVFG